MAETRHIGQNPSGPRTAGSAQLGVGFRYGVSLEDADLDPWGMGLGADVGYTLRSAVYVGAVFDYFFGESMDLLPGMKVSSNVWQLSAEGGYDVGFGEHWVIRPKLGVGIAHAMANFDDCPAGIQCVDSSDTHVLLGPGATFMAFTKSLSATIDARYAVVLADETASALIFSIGMGF